MRFSILAAVALGAAGCATVLKPQQTNVAVASQTPGALVLVDGMQMGVTPTLVPLSTKNDHLITVRGANGEMSCKFNSSVSGGWLVLDIVFTPAWLVDLVTSGWSSLDRNDCMVPI
jgi:PEGA domain-containing protein